MFSWYKYLIVSLVFSHLGFWSGSLFLIAPFPDLCLLVLFFCTKVICLICSGSHELEITITSLFIYKKLSADVAFTTNFINTIPVGSVAGPVGAGKSDLIP